MSKLIIVNGLPATGKSTLVAWLAKELTLPFFSKDDFKELLADTVGFSDHESTKPFGKASYVSLFLVAKRCIEANISLIIEANFTLEKETKDFLSYLERKDMEVIEILCYTESQVLASRFTERKRHPVHHTLGGDERKRYLETIIQKGKGGSLGAGRLLEVDTSDPANIPYEDILRFIESENF